MPNTQNAKKALRQSKKRRLRNRVQRSVLRTLVKKMRSTDSSEDAQARDAGFRLVTKKLDQAAAKKLIHRNKAARIKSRLARQIAKVMSPAETAESSES